VQQEKSTADKNSSGDNDKLKGLGAFLTQQSGGQGEKGKPAFESSRQKNTGIAAMQSSALNHDVLARKGSMSYLINQANIMYNKTDNVKLTQEEFCNDIEFTYGVPLIVLDFVDGICGTEFIKEIREIKRPWRLVNRMEQYDIEFNEMK